MVFRVEDIFGYQAEDVLVVCHSLQGGTKEILSAINERNPDRNFLIQLCSSTLKVSRYTYSG